MKTGYGFTEFENITEFKTWLEKQSVSRTITRLQVHHMYAPSYANWPTDIALRRQYNTKTYHQNTNGWDDIAQHFSIFPDGHIVTGRSLNKTPIGIKGWNTNAICIEIYGNFDKDVMYKAQKDAIIGCYALLAKKFNIKIDSTGIRPHCWFTAGGTYLGDYNSSRSAKTCPGTKFFGGNTKASFNANFYPAIKNYGSTDSGDTGNSDIHEIPNYKAVTTDNLNCRTTPSTTGEIKVTIPKGTTVEVAYHNVGDTWAFLREYWGWVSIAYLNKVAEPNPEPTTFMVKVIYKGTDGVNIRQDADFNSPIVGTVYFGEAFTIVETKNGLGKLKSGAGWITLNETYVHRV